MLSGVVFTPIQWTEFASLICAALSGLGNHSGVKPGALPRAIIGRPCRAAATHRPELMNAPSLPLGSPAGSKSTGHEKQETRDWLENILEDQLDLREDFNSKNEQSERDMRARRPSSIS